MTPAEQTAKREITAALAKLEAAMQRPVTGLSVVMSDVTTVDDVNRRYSRDIVFHYDERPEYLPFVSGGAT